MREERWKDKMTNELSVLTLDDVTFLDRLFLI